MKDIQKIPVIILGGGLGTRLRPVIYDRPKVLAPIGDKTILDRVMENLIRQNFKNFILSVGYLQNMIRDHIAGRYWPENISVLFSEEKEPLGTGGAIKKALDAADHDLAIILNGDTLFPINYQTLINFHISKNAEISIGLRKIEDASASGTVLSDNSKRILRLQEKNNMKQSGVVNGGVYIFQKNVLNRFNLPEKFSIEKDFFERSINEIDAYGLAFEEYFIDIGTPENYRKANNDLH